MRIPQRWATLAPRQGQLRGRRRALFLAFLSIVLLAGAAVSATEQEPDILRWKGKSYDLYTNPLERYLASHPDVWRDRAMLSTANWRGYVATWTIEDDRLKLTDVNTGRRPERVNALGKLFPGQEVVLADWYTGNLLVPDGKLLHRGDFSYSAVHSKYLLFRIEKGIVTAQRELGERAYMEFKRSQFALFKKTDAYRALVAQSGNSLKPDQVDEFIFLFAVEEYTSTIFDEGNAKLPNKRMHPTAAGAREERPRLKPER